MSVVVKKKAWLYKQGHILTNGRGRTPSVSVKDGRPVAAILEEAVKNGVVFSDFSVDNVVRNSTGEATKVIKPKVESDGFVEPAPYRFDERLFMAIETGTKRVRSMREACNNCRVSLVVCYCEIPRIVAIPPMMGSVAVTIVPKSGE